MSSKWLNKDKSLGHGRQNGLTMSNTIAISAIKMMKGFIAIDMAKSHFRAVKLIIESLSVVSTYNKRCVYIYIFKYRYIYIYIYI